MMPYPGKYSRRFPHLDLRHLETGKPPAPNSGRGGSLARRTANRQNPAHRKYARVVNHGALLT